MVKNRRNIVLILVCSIILVAILLLIFGKSNDKNGGFPSNGEVTRYEWMEMLCEKTGITEYQNSEPYFKDVDEDNEYFSYIQAAVEWGLLDTSSDFEGDRPVSGKCIALTAIKTIEEKKIQIYYEKENEITDDDCIALAQETGIVTEEQLKKGFSEEECRQVLVALEKLCFEILWKDDYYDVTYQNDTIELAPEVVVWNNADSSEIMVTDEVLDSLEIGKIIVFEQYNTKIKIARKVAAVAPDGTVSLSSVNLDEVVENITVSDMEELTVENIVNYYGLEENVDTAGNLNYQQSDKNNISFAGFDIYAENKGFKISLDTEEENEEKYLKIQLTDNNTGISYTLPISEEVEPDSDYFAEIDVKQIFIGGQIAYSALKNKLEYVDVTVGADVALKGGIKADEEKRILLCKTSVPLGYGLASADIQIYLVLSLEGTISFEAEVPVLASVCYENGKGLRDFEHEISVEEPKLEANCTAGAMLRLEPVLVVLGCLNVMDAEVDVGITAEASAILRPDSQLCTEVTIAFPVITFSVCGDDDTDTIMGNMGLSKEWEIISEDDAPFQLGVHYELLPDMTEQFVEKCTYKNQEKELANSTHKEQEKELINNTDENQEKETFSNTYVTKYGATQFAFDYPDSWVIESETTNDVLKESVVLKNEQGLTMNYWAYNRFPIGAAGHAVLYILDVQEMMDSSIEDYKIAKIQRVGWTDMNTGEDVSEDRVITYYAILHKDDVGKVEHAGSANMNGVWEGCSFAYNSSHYMLFVEAANGKFTQKEEKEVLAILSSFRIVNQENAMIVDDPIYAALQKGDFSYFAGTYKAMEGLDDKYGGEGRLENLILHENGVVTQEGPWYDEQPYPEVEPMSVKKGEDGSYSCKVIDSNNFHYYFEIYPEGVIDPYNLDNRVSISLEVPRIRCVLFAGGYKSIVYYKVDD